MRKLRKIGYNDFFGTDFQLSRIDKNFQDLEDKEKSQIITKVIDLLFYD